jgi:hypothetical protein
MKTYLVSYAQGNIAITKVIQANSEKIAISNFIQMYDQYDITSNEVDVMECEEFNVNVETVFNKLKQIHGTKK